MSGTTTTRKPSLVFSATYGGADGLAEIHGMLSRDNGHLVFLADDGELFFLTDAEWIQFGMTHGEVGLAVCQAMADTRAAQAERRLLEATNRLESIV
jgi:hypothetical protein